MDVCVSSEWPDGLIITYEYLQKRGDRNCHSRRFNNSMTLRPLKRVYKEVTVGHVDGVPAVLLDERPLRTPAMAPLLLPNESLATAVAEEWRDQGEEVLRDSMPLTRIAVSAIDRVAPARCEVVAQIAAYGRTDLLCYRSEQPELAARQAENWQPVLDWAERELSARLVVVDGVMPVTQDPAALQALQRVGRGPYGCGACGALLGDVDDRFPGARTGPVPWPHRCRENVGTGPPRRDLAGRTLGRRRRSGRTW